jgi:acetyl-CoA carboxylase biotin carboxylase subunit
MLYAGYTVPPFYDSLLGKLIVWDETREAAITRLVRALKETRIEGLRTTKPLFLALADDPACRECRSHPLAGRLAFHPFRPAGAGA